MRNSWSRAWSVVGPNGFWSRACAWLVDVSGGLRVAYDDRARSARQATRRWFRLQPTRWKLRAEALGVHAGAPCNLSTHSSDRAQSHRRACSVRRCTHCRGRVLYHRAYGKAHNSGARDCEAIFLTSARRVRTDPAVSVVVFLVAVWYGVSQRHHLHRLDANAAPKDEDKLSVSPSDAHAAPDRTSVRRLKVPVLATWRYAPGLVASYSYCTTHLSRVQTPFESLNAGASLQQPSPL